MLLIGSGEFKGTSKIRIERDDLPEEAFGKWGMNWNDLEIVGFVADQEIKSVKLAAAPIPTKLEIVPDENEICASKRDCVRVMVRALDQFGNKMPFLTDQIQIEVNGQGKLIGPEISPFLGGSTGFWIQSNGNTGAISVSIETGSFKKQSITIDSKSLLDGLSLVS